MDKNKNTSAASAAETPAAPKKVLRVGRVAFALLLMTYAMDQRRSNETLGDLTSSVSDLKDSLSGMQTAQSALEENGALKNEIQDLQEQIDTLLGTIDSLTAAGEQQGQVLERTKEAMDYFWQIDEAYVRGRYSLCRDLIAVLEDTSSGEAPLKSYLPQESYTDNGRFSPADRYQEIWDALY